jgi:hypothetical protein
MYFTGSAYSVHDGNQSNVFKGINAYEYPGVTYPGKDTTTWHHLNWKCTDCHLGTVFHPADSTGGHTFRINRNDPRCNICHTLPGLLQSDSATVIGLLDQLGDLLTSRKVFTKTAGVTGPSAYKAQATHDFYGNLYSPAAADSAKYYASTASDNSLSLTTGLLTYDNMVTWAKDKTYAGRIGRKWTGGEFGAAYNFSYIFNADWVHSFGIHNPKYTIAVLQASINWLNSH